MIITRTRRIHLDWDSSLGGHASQNSLCQWAPTNVAQADEENACHPKRLLAAQGRGYRNRPESPLTMAAISKPIQFRAKLLRPTEPPKGESWAFLKLPAEASNQLPSRSMVSVEGTFNRTPFLTTLLPDGEGGHWMKVEEALQKQAGAKSGDVIEIELAPTTTEPEPEVPGDVQSALEAAGPKAMATWKSITPKARRDYVFWIVSGKKAETRTKRIEVACSKLAAGNRRPCCFDRSGMYDKSLSCPIAEEE